MYRSIHFCMDIYICTNTLWYLYMYTLLLPVCYIFDIFLLNVSKEGLKKSCGLPAAERVSSKTAEGQREASDPGCHRRGTSLFQSGTLVQVLQRSSPPRPFQSRTTFPSRPPKSNSISPCRCCSSQTTNERKTTRLRCRHFRKGASPCLCVHHLGVAQSNTTSGPAWYAPQWAQDQSPREREREKRAQVPLGTGSRARTSCKQLDQTNKNYLN